MRWQKKKPGDPLKIPAGAWNALLELLEQRDNFLAQLGKTGTIDTRIKVRNDTGSDLGRYQVVRIADPIVSPTDNLSEFLANPCFSGATPDGEHNRIAIVQEPIAAGAIGWAVAAGLTHAYVSGNEGHGFAVPQAGDCTGFASAPSGPVAILWRETGTGLRRCFVRVGNHPMDVRRLRLLAPLTHCGEADALLLTGTADTPPCDGQIIVKVRDSLGVTGSGGLPAGAFVWAVLMPDAGKFEVISYGFGCCESPSQSDSDQSDSDQSDSGPSESSMPSESSTPSGSAPPSQSGTQPPSGSGSSWPPQPSSAPSSSSSSPSSGSSSASPSPSASASPSGSGSATGSSSASPSPSASASPSGSGSATGSSGASPSPSASASPSGSGSATGSSGSDGGQAIPCDDCLCQWTWNQQAGVWELKQPCQVGPRECPGCMCEPPPFEGYPGAEPYERCYGL